MVTMVVTIAHFLRSPSRSLHPLALIPEHYHSALFVVIDNNPLHPTTLTSPSPSSATSHPAATDMPRAELVSLPNELLYMLGEQLGI